MYFVLSDSDESDETLSLSESLSLSLSDLLDLLESESLEDSSLPFFFYFLFFELSVKVTFLGFSCLTSFTSLVSSF